MAIPFQTIGALAGQIGQAIAQKKQNEAQRKWATEQQTLAWKRNLEQWKRENEYNDPSQQMARLKAAGLNPNMVYGSGSATTTSASSPTFKEAEGQFNNPLGNLNPLAVSNASIAQQQARSIRLDNLEKEYLLGLRDPEYHEVDVTITDPETGLQKVIGYYKDTKNIVYNRARATSEKIRYDRDFARVKATYADKGINFNDNTAIRMVMSALINEGIDPIKATVGQIKKALNALYSSDE